MIANGIRIFRMSSAVWENGLKTGISRVTLSSEKDETEAMFPVLKKADWRRKKKKRAMRASAIVRARWFCDLTFSLAALVAFEGDTCPTGSADGLGLALEPLVLLVVALPLEAVEFDGVVVEGGEGRM